MTDQRGRLLMAALGFAGLPRPSYDRALWALRIWLDSWAGIGRIGRIAVGMARQGFDLQLTRYDERGWRATFYTTGMEHSAFYNAPLRLFAPAADVLSVEGQVRRAGGEQGSAAAHA